MTSLEIDPGRSLRCGNTVLDAGTVTLRVGEASCDLTWSEFRLLHLLFRQPNQLLPRIALMQSMFDGQERRPAEGILRVYIHRVRGRLLDIGSDLAISTRHGIGWILVVPVRKD